MLTGTGPCYRCFPELANRPLMQVASSRGRRVWMTRWAPLVESVVLVDATGREFLVSELAHNQLDPYGIPRLNPAHAGESLNPAILRTGVPR